MAESTPEYLTNRDLFSNHYLSDHLPETEDWNTVDEDALQAAYEEINDIYERRKDSVQKYNEAQLQRRLIDPVMEALGIEFAVEESVQKNQRRPDYGFFASEEAVDDAFDRKAGNGDFYANATAVADAKYWNRSLDTQGRNDQTFENPSFQISVYLDETPAEWAVLTNGRQWRIYYAKTAHRLDSYYEIDLPTLLEACDPDTEDGLEPFKYFFQFFRHEAFIDDGRGCFLDRVLHESNIFAEELGEDLKENIYEAIEVLADGFLSYHENDLYEDDLDLVHDASLIYLYRVIFVLYAESEGRNLLDTANEYYRDRFSLNDLKTDIAETLDGPDADYPAWDDDLWQRLNDLFELIDRGSEAKGIPEDDLYVPAYNGGLFRTNPDEADPREAHFLQEYSVGDEHLAEVIDLLTRSHVGNGDEKTFADYSSLNIRHLGSIYEGLLEYQLNVADEPLAVSDGEYVPAGPDDEVVVEEDEAYLTTDSGERKTTGSYYTPDYVVEYIGENTLDPLLSEIRDDLLREHGQFAEQFAERVFDLKILDPAMGSGHFLTDVIDYLAREVIDAQQKQAVQQADADIDPSHDINWARRQVAQKCVYGVDVNPLAVELAKVSLWLRTLAAEQPLAFLDHHLKAGNSLIGSDIEEIDELETDLDNGTANQSTLAEYGVVRKGTIEQLMEVYQEFIAIENRDRADVKEMERKYRQIEQNELRNRLVAMANVHTAEQYGVDVPGGAYEWMAESLDDDDAWADVTGEHWFQQAQELADEKDCLHWKLEFPEVFYDEHGESLESPGFDVVLGNPPYVRIYRGALAADDVEYWRDRFRSAHMKFDLYVVFMELSIDLARDDGYMSMIVPGKFMNSPYGEPLRNQILDETRIESVLDLRDRDVFDEVTVSNVIPVLRKGDGDGDPFPVLRMNGEGAGIEAYNHLTEDVIRAAEDNSIRLSKSQDDVLLTEKVEERSLRFDDIYYANWGLRTGTKEKTEKYVVESPPSDTDAPVHPMIRGQDVIDRYRLAEPSEHIIYEKDDLYNPMFEELFENEKLVFRKISGEGLMAAVDEDDLYCFSTLIPCVNISEVAHVDRSGIPTETDACHEYTDPYYALALVNSSLMDWYYQTNLSDDLSVVPKHIQRLPIASIDFDGDADRDLTVDEAVALLDDEGPRPVLDAAETHLETGDEAFVHDLLAELARRMSEYNDELLSLNLDLLDYLGNYAEGPELTQAGRMQPASGVSTTLLEETAESYDGLRVGELSGRIEDDVVVVEATARYKPDNESEYDADRWTEPDQWGYVETKEAISALELRGLDEMEAELVCDFLDLLNEQDDGFAGFYESATKTISPLNRIKDIVIPDFESVESDYEPFLRNRRHADQLRGKIDTTDDLIDEIVYRLYGLEDEEIEVVEETI